MLVAKNSKVPKIVKKIVSYHNCQIKSLKSKSGSDIP